MGRSALVMLLAGTLLAIALFALYTYASTPADCIIHDGLEYCR